MQNIDSDLIRGNIDTIILKTMLKEDKYGLDIIKEVSEKSSGTYELKQPTLYSCLKRLENQELISSYWVDSDIGGKRHYYKLTDKGRDFYNKKQEEWAKSKFIIDNLLSNYDYEEYRLVKKDEFDEMLEKKANAPLYSNEIPAQNELNNEQNTAEDFQQSENEDSNEPIEVIDHIEPDYSNKSNDFENDESTSNLEEISDYEIEQIENLNKDFQNKNIDNDEVFELGNNDNQDFEDDENDYESIQSSQSPSNDLTENDDDYPVYFSAKKDEIEEEPEEIVSYETQDQSSNELNILSRLRDQDEEINTYIGDQKSYVNHLNQLDESQLEQQDLLDSSLYIHPDEVNKSINEFSEAIERLNNFNNFNSEEDEETEILEENFDDTEIQNSDNFNYEEREEDDELEPQRPEFNDLDELESLKNISSNNFFDSEDTTDYFKQNNYQTKFENNTNNYDFEPENLNNIAIENAVNSANEDDLEDYSSYSTSDSYNDNFTNYTEQSREESNETSYSYENENNYDKMSEIDKVISGNMSTEYVEATPNYYTSNTINYRDKLSDLSKYSRVTLSEEKNEETNKEALEKAKDISEITKELEEEGIKIKEHYKSTNGKRLERNYLLANKINLMKSLIMFFGYVFVLSALYIVLNNTPMRENSWFSIKPFLLWFIPFAVILVYNAIIFMVNPYKKVEAKYHSRIMMFIAFIITIQLLLITYCINLQLGFYSFTQSEYNHLYWIIPSIVSLAPIIDNLVYLALFKSRNFNV